MRFSEPMIDDELEIEDASGDDVEEVNDDDDDDDVVNNILQSLLQKRSECNFFFCLKLLPPEKHWRVSSRFRRMACGGHFCFVCASQAHIARRVSHVLVYHRVFLTFFFPIGTIVSSLAGTCSESYFEVLVSC